ncbi:MAG TPA: outer membrane beta-barrel protein [Polyangiaceae bacterium]|nr:outer membrane beta-barrel protein [Polyangiaceae bacterium]
MRLPKQKWTAFVLLFLGPSAALLCSVNAFAQSVSRPFQLSFGANALAYERTKTSIDGDSATATSTELGPEAAGFTVGVGYRASESWLVGLNLHGSRSRVTDGRDGTPALTRSAYAVMPRLEYWLAPDKQVSPYLGATLGFRGSSASAGPDAKSSTSDFSIGGLAGVRVFAAQGFSVDPSIALLALTGSGEAGSAKLDRGGFAFLLGVSLSGWFGTDPPAALAAGAAAAPAPSNAPAAAPAPIDSTEAPPPVAAEEPPPLEIKREPDGTMRAEIWLGDGRRLRVMGRPNHESNSVLATLLNGTSSGAPSRTCTALNVVIDGRPHAIVPGPRAVAGSGAVQWLMTPAVLLAIGEAKQSAQLERCGTSSEVMRAARGLLGDFYREFRSTAERYGRRVPEALAD